MQRVQSFDKPFQHTQNGEIENKVVNPAGVAPQYSQNDKLGIPQPSKPGRSNAVPDFQKYNWQRETSLPSRAYKNLPLHSVYLNGENIVGLRNQSLEGVNVRFDAQGNVYIEAPHYEIHHDTSYHPLLPEEVPQFQKEVPDFSRKNVPSRRKAETKPGAAANSRAPSADADAPADPTE